MSKLTFGSAAALLAFLSVLSSLCGCGTVVPETLGIDAGGDAADAATEAAPEVVLLEVPARIAVGDTVELAFTLRAAAGASIEWSVVSGGGEFRAASGTAFTNPAGLARVTTAFVAPAVAGDVEHFLSLSARGTARARFTTRVRSLVPYGEAVAFPDNGGQSIAPNYLFGQTVQLAQDGFVLRLGLVSAAAGYNARLALYRDAQGVPGELVVGMPNLAPVGAGAFSFAVAPTQVAAGTYWILLNADASAPVHQSPSENSPHASVALRTNDPLPSTLTSVQTLPSRKNNLYVLLANY